VFNQWSTSDLALSPSDSQHKSSIPRFVLRIFSILMRDNLAIVINCPQERLFFLFFLFCFLFCLFFWISKIIELWVHGNLIVHSILVKTHRELIAQASFWTPGRSLPLIFCIHVRLGPIYWGVIYLAKKIIRWWYFTCKKPGNIICDGILHVNMFYYFKTPYFTCNVFTKFTYNEYIGHYFFIARCSTIFA
jgi:hypothetical protein